MRWTYSAADLIEKLVKKEGRAEWEKIEAIQKAGLDPVEGIHVTSKDIRIQMWEEEGPYEDGTWVESDLRDELENLHKLKLNKPKKKKKKGGIQMGGDVNGERGRV